MVRTARCGYSLALRTLAITAAFFAAAAPLAAHTEATPSMMGSPVPVVKFYVGPWGSAATHWNTPCTPQNPFLTLDQARLEIRAYRAALDVNDGPLDITVHIAGGLYPLASRVAFGPEDSGWAGHPITYIAWNPNGIGGVFSDDVLFSGGVRVGGGGAGGNWTLVNINAGTPQATTAWRCTVPSTITDIRDVWVNNERMTRARFPNIQPCTTLPQNYENPTMPPCPNQGFMLVKHVAATVDSVKHQKVTIEVVDASGAIPVPFNNDWSKVELVGHRIYVNPQQRVHSALLDTPTQVTLDFPITTVPTGQTGNDDHMDLGAFGVFRWNTWQQNPTYSYIFDFWDL